jgi:hypothetical protein
MDVQRATLASSGLVKIMDVHVVSIQSLPPKRKEKVLGSEDILNVQIAFKRSWKHGKRTRDPIFAETDDSLLRHVHRLPCREITRAELALAHTGEHIRNYYTPPPWHQTSAKAIIRLPTPPPSSTGSATTNTISESTCTTPPPLNTATIESDTGVRTDEKNKVTFADSPIKMEFEQDFPPLESPTGTSFRDKFTGSPHKRRASGLDMDLMTALAADKDEIEVKPSVWPVTLTHMMGCGELAIGIFLMTHLTVSRGYYV